MGRLDGRMAGWLAGWLAGGGSGCDVGVDVGRERERGRGLISQGTVPGGLDILKIFLGGPREKRSQREEGRPAWRAENGLTI